MGTRGIEIVGMDVKELITTLNKAFADEWLAYYQYWIGARVAKGPMRNAVVAELDEHAMDEFRHAGMVADRILQLGGTPILKPQDWYKLTNCGYESPENPYVRNLIEQNIKGEQCAIDVYKSLVETVHEKDPVTYNIALQILTNEIEHEEDLQALLEDMELMIKDKG
jgi:bacterioferritin